MQKHFALMTGIAVFSIVDNARTQIKARKVARIALDTIEEKQQAYALIEYLVHLLNENDVPLTEFDAIAIHAICE